MSNEKNDHRLQAITSLMHQLIITRALIPFSQAS